ncbi:carbohydrate ABC transporter permease [Specibacter sp. NPDC057265]|uniref:carbohydrate ABC transporter permease n=1 Tax=Specibacter sp. NPDC057265 TaxID=3346075 RepID=UPI00363BB02B
MSTVQDHLPLAPLAAAGPAPVQPNRRRPTRRAALGTAGRYLTLVLALVLLVGPLVVPLLAAFKAPGEDLFGPNATVLPQNWSLDAFRELLDRIPIFAYMGNSLMVAVLAVGSNVIFASLAGYMLSRQGWRGRKTVYLLLISAMIFPFESIMVSLFAQVRGIGLTDTLAGVWVPGMVAVLNVLLMRAAFMAVPSEIEDAALMDGAGEFRRFWQIFLPATRGVLTVVVITTFITVWDDFLWPLLILRSDENLTLMLGLSQLQGNFGLDYRVVLAGAVAAFVPVAILFFICQKYFFKGMESGGVKL